MIEVIELTKRYMDGHTPVLALQGVSCTLHKGEFIAIIGRNGSGKSTFLQHLSLIDVPTSGTILLHGVDTGVHSDEQRAAIRLKHFGYIFQNYALLPELTALENVMLPALAWGIDRTKVAQRAEKLLRFIGLETKMDHQPTMLSGGEQQRVSIARALINNPMVVFADEPCANLDTASSKHIMQYLSLLSTRLQVTVVMVTHEPEDLKYANRILEMRDGRLIKDSAHQG